MRKISFPLSDSMVRAELLRLDLTELELLGREPPTLTMASSQAIEKHQKTFCLPHTLVCGLFLVFRFPERNTYKYYRNIQKIFFNSPKVR